VKVSYVDLFSGAGGLGEGFQQEKFIPIYINDIDKSALKTCQLRKAYHKLLDLGKIDSYYDYIQSVKKNNKPSFYDPTSFIKNHNSLSFIINKISSFDEISKKNISYHYKEIKKT